MSYKLYQTIIKSMTDFVSFFKVKTLFLGIGMMDQLYLARAKMPKNSYLIKDISYVNDNRNEHRMDLSRPRNYQGSLMPVILHIHGGAWVYGDKNSYYSYYGMKLSEYGFGVFTVNYRLVPTVTVNEQIQDILQAIEYIVNNAREYGLDEKRIYLVGDSSGAYLASLIGCMIGKPDWIENNRTNYLKSVRGLGLNCGIYDFNTFLSKDVNFPCKKEIVYMAFGRDKKPNAGILKVYSVFDHMTHEFPPSFVMGTEADGIYMETERIVAAMKKRNIRFDSCIYPKRLRLPHDFHLKHKYWESEEAMRKMLSFFKAL